MSIDWSDDIVIAELNDEPAFSEELANLQRRLDAVDDAESTPCVILDMKDVTYLNSSNIAQMLRMRKKLSERERAMAVCSVRDQVWSIMMVTGLDKVFRFAPDTATALAALQIESDNA